jgi:tetratricopeptide (TPR) repeat protein
VELDPDYAEAHNNFGVALVQTGKLEEAIAQFRAALRYDPDSARGQSNLGVTLARAGRFAEAIPVLQKVAEANPKAAEIHDTLARALAQERRPEEAMAQWRKAIEGDPGYAEAHHRLGNALYGQGKFAEALAEWRQGLRTDPDNAAVLAQSAWILATCGEASVRNGAEAVKLGEQARDLSGGREPAILDVLAAAYAEAGRFSDAVETARRALSLADGRLAPAVRERLALYEKRNPYRAR